MFKVQVFDTQALNGGKWKDAAVILESEFGYCYAFSSLNPFVSEELEVAVEEAQGVAGNAGVRTRVIDLAADEVVYDSGVRTIRTEPPQ